MSSSVQIEEGGSRTDPGTLVDVRAGPERAFDSRTAVPSGSRTIRNIRVDIPHVNCSYLKR